MNNNKKYFILKKVQLAALLAVLFSFYNCVRHSDMQDHGADFLQGVWVQDSIANQDQMIGYTIHEFKVTCDSIYAIMKVHSKTQSIPDSCYGDGNWTEYAKAVYAVRGDSIIVDGVYTKENGKQKISGCYKTGQYTPRFKVAYIGKDSVVLENRFDARPIILRKTKDIVCVPKKRWEL